MPKNYTKTTACWLTFTNRIKLARLASSWLIRVFLAHAVSSMSLDQRKTQMQHHERNFFVNYACFAFEIRTDCQPLSFFWYTFVLLFFLTCSIPLPESSRKYKGYVFSPLAIGNQISSRNDGSAIFFLFCFESLRGVQTICRTLWFMLR